MGKEDRTIAVITDLDGEVVAAIPLDGGKHIIHKDYTLRFCADKDVRFIPIKVAPDKCITRCRIEESAIIRRG